tara:strand:+ start:313 stop:510 length:198 start_codon:yes stop_codon:yes gene_type:complete
MKRKMKCKNYWAGFTDNKVKVGWSKYYKHISCDPEVLKVSEISFTKKQWIYFKSIVDDMFKEHYL